MTWRANSIPTKLARLTLLTALFHGFVQSAFGQESAPRAGFTNVQPTRVVFLPDQNFLPKSGLLIFSGDIRTYLGLLENLQFYSLTRMTFTVQIPADLGKLTR
jgi:hypothetical protein